MQDCPADFNPGSGKQRLNRDELIAIGYRIVNCEGSEAEIDSLMRIFDRNVAHPNGSNLFFYPEDYNARKTDISKYDLTVEEIVDICLKYKPIYL